MSGEKTSLTGEDEKFERAMLECIQKGWMALTGTFDDNGEPLYRLTDAGRAHVDSMGLSARTVSVSAEEKKDA